jgi:biotin synthase
MNARDLAEKSLAGKPLSRAEARQVLEWPDADLMTLVSEVHRVRRQHFGNRVKLNFLVNIKSGLCPEDCSYCSQSKVSRAPIDKYRLMAEGEIVRAAEQAARNKAARLCLVASGRGPSDNDVAAVARAVRQVKESHPDLEVCCCLGLLADGQASTLKTAGVHAYNHNLNTSERFYGDICQTHAFSDRVETVQKAQAEGLSSCCGALFGMGETAEDIIDVAFRLRELNVDSIPINFLIPIQGTPLAQVETLNPRACLKILCLFRLICPSAELRIAGGRELHLRSLQPLGLLIANSLFIGDYLTTAGQAPSADLEMIRDLGFEIVGEPPPEPAPSGASLADRVTILKK